jgi:hypothetical protein
MSEHREWTIAYSHRTLVQRSQDNTVQRIFFLKFVWLLLFRYAAVVPLDDEVLPRYGNTLVRRTKYGQ